MIQFSRLPNEIRTVFISSTSGQDYRGRDLPAHRENIEKIIHHLLSHSFFPIWMGYNAAYDRSTLEVSLTAVSECDIFLMLVNGSPGTIVSEGKTFIMREFEQAREKGKPVLSFISVEAVKTAKGTIGEFIRELLVPTSGVTAYIYKDATDLISKLSVSLQQCLRESEIPYYLRSENYWEAVNTLNAEINALKKTAESYSSLRQSYNYVIRETFNLSIAATFSRISQKQNSTDIMEAFMPLREDLHRLVDSLMKDWTNHPLLLLLAEENIKRLSIAFDDLTSEQGYRPFNIEDLQKVCRLLYGESLKKIDAVSVISENEKFRNYKRYWNHPELGKTFSQLNAEFLRRIPTPSLKRIFLCDSSIDTIRNGQAGDWLRGSALPQCAAGGKIKICDLSNVNDQSLVQDYGIYSHFIGASDAGKYLLLAPNEMNETSDVLQTRLIADARRISAAEIEFDRLWNSMPYEPISTFKNLECAREYTDFDKGTVHDLIGDEVILRSGRVLNPLRVTRFQNPVPRKDNVQYANDLLEYVFRYYPRSSIIYISDSVSVDGLLVDNMRRLLGVQNQKKLLAYLNDPHSDIFNAIINETFYSHRWENLALFAEWAMQQVGAVSDWLVVAEINETLWAPRGLKPDANKALMNARLGAIQSIVYSYIGFLDQFDKMRVANVLRMVYNETGSEQYQSIIKDNEDYRAILTIAISLGLLSHVTNISEDARGGQMLIDKAELNFEHIRRIVNDLLTDYKILGIHDLLYRIYFNLVSEKGKALTLKKGLNVNVIAQDWQDISERAQSGSPTIFERFRNEELLETIKVCNQPNSDESIVLNQSAFNFIEFVKRNGGAVLGVSDRPDEATYNAEKSLLKTEMTRYGYDIRKELEKLI